MNDLLAIVKDKHDKTISDRQDLWRWSVSHTSEFQSLIWQVGEVVGDRDKLEVYCPAFSSALIQTNDTSVCMVFDSPTSPILPSQVKLGREHA